MLLAWADDLIRRACEGSDAGAAVWGATGARVVGLAVGVVDAAANLAALDTLSTTSLRVGRLGPVPVIAIEYRSVEILGRPGTKQAMLRVPDTDADISSVHHADRLYIHQVRCDGRAATQGRAA